MHFCISGCISCMMCSLLMLMLLSVSLPVMQHNSASLCNNGLTGQGPVWGKDFCEPKEHCVSRESQLFPTRGMGKHI